MYTIQTNRSGSRTMQISDAHLETIARYDLFLDLRPATGIIDEGVLDRLKLTVRSLIASSQEDCKDLLDLCIDVIYHNNMKAFGLNELMILYNVWKNERMATDNQA